MSSSGLIGAFISNPVNRAALGDPQFHDQTGLRRYFDGMWSFVRDMAERLRARRSPNDPRPDLPRRSI